MIATPAPAWAIDPICGLPITNADRIETQRLLTQFLAEVATADEDDDELRLVKAEVACD